MFDLSRLVMIVQMFNRHGEGMYVNITNKNNYIYLRSNGVENVSNDRLQCKSTRAGVEYNGTISQT